MYMKNSIKTDVIRPSHCHQVPQAGFPQRLPVRSAKNVNANPGLAILLAALSASGCLQIKLNILATVRLVYANKAHQAAGT